MTPAEGLPISKLIDAKVLSKSAGPVEETKKLIADWCAGRGGIEPRLRD